MALFTTWHRAREAGIDLLQAYSDVGGVLGALAHEAERVRTDVLTERERGCLLSLFARLVRLGETGGATRRITPFADLGQERTTLARRLADARSARLLLAGEESVEIAHEALISQWPWSTTSRRLAS